MNTHHDACSLPSAAQIKRLKTIRSELSEAVSQYIAPGKRRYTFTPDIARLARLEALVAAEIACCGFVQIDLQSADEVTLSIAGPESFLAQLEKKRTTAPWGVAVAGVAAMATCALPLALGAAAVWIEGGGFVLLLLAALMLGWRYLKNRSAALGLNTQTE